MATNTRTLSDEDYKEYNKALLKASKITQKQTFDRDKFEQLRAMTERGANKAN